MSYALQVVLKSNEVPWSSCYEPPPRHQPKDDPAALRWAYDMAEGMGDAYQCTLLRDGAAIYDCSKPIADVSGIDPSALILE